MIGFAGMANGSSMAFLLLRCRRNLVIKIQNMSLDKLKEYQQRRNFQKTKEPQGKVKELKKGKLAYVVQKHDASRLHYDLRLEYKGVLMSWAIPKEPKMDKEKRLAVRTEDHPVEYADFEGEIPEGEYGAGKVEIWDKGVWEPESVKKEKIVAIIKGKKLKGRFALVQLKNQPKNWILLKAKEI